MYLCKRISYITFTDGLYGIVLVVIVVFIYIFHR